MRSGPAPRLTEFADVKREAEHIASRVSKMLGNGLSERHIVVMYGSFEMETQLEHAFGRVGLPYFHVQARDSTGRQTNRDKAVHVLHLVRSSTLTGMKGLEFSRVFIGGVNQIRVPDVAEEDQLQAAKSQLYAAMTRAMDELEITMSGDGEIGRALREAGRLRRVD